MLAAHVVHANGRIGLLVQNLVSAQPTAVEVMVFVALQNEILELEHLFAAGRAQICE